MLVDSFEFLGPREQALVAVLAGRTRVEVAIDRDASERARYTASRLESLHGAASVEELPPRAEAGAVSAHRAFDHEAQLRGIARAIKRRLGEEETLRPSDVAVTFRRASPHLALARRVSPSTTSRSTRPPASGWRRVRSGPGCCRCCGCRRTTGG